MKSGILLIDKPKGVTSRDVVNMVCKKFNTKKVGHTGTLDPIATGLMIICINKATSLVEIITGEDKEYVANVKLGMLTDTLDVTGKIKKENYNYKLNKNELEEVLNSFVGSYWQEVPIYSAIKVNGKKLYEYARKSLEVELPKRLVDIKNISLIELNDDNFTFKVTVSKGTYIRSLIKDIGQKLNIYMSLNELRRTKINKINISDAKKIEDLNEDDIVNIEDFLEFPKIYVDNILEKKILNGVRIKNDYNSEYVMFFNNNKKLLALYKANEKNELCMFKLF